MLRKFGNYLAIIALSLFVTGNSVLANSNTGKGKAEFKKITVDDNKDFNYYNEFLRGGGKHAYTVKVEAGKEVKIRVRSAKGVALKIQTPDGQTKNNSAEKYFEINLSTAGEYVVEVESLFIAQYSVEIFSK